MGWALWRTAGAYSALSPAGRAPSPARRQPVSDQGWSGGGGGGRPGGGGVPAQIGGETGMSSSPVRHDTQDICTVTFQPSSATQP